MFEVTLMYSGKEAGAIEKTTLDWNP